MNTKQFRAQLREMGLSARKRKGLEVLDIIHDGTELCTVYYAELHPITHASEILAKKLKPEYIPSLG